MADGRNIDNPGRPGERASSEVREAMDSLFVGSLYGELTPAEQAQLSAHLEAHPTDRQALDGLQSARQMVRDSGIADYPLDPPQAISALLLQEAARRAPKRDVEQSWFARMISVVVAHPALASVASLVLVVGVGSALYMRNGEMPLAERAAGQSRMAASEARQERPPAPEAVAVAESQAKPTADTEAVRVGLDEEAAGLDQKERGVGAVAKTPAKQKRAAELKSTAKLAKDAPPELDRAKSDDAGKSAVRDEVRAAKKATANTSSKSFDSPADIADKAEALGTSSNAQRRAEAASVADADSERYDAPAGRFAAPPPSVAPTPRAQATRAAIANASPGQASSGKASVAQAPSPQAINAQAQVAKQSTAKPSVAQAAPAKSLPSQSPPAQVTNAAPSVAAEAYGGGASATKNQTQSSAWARDAYRRVLGLVRAGKCQDATPLLTQLKNRDPDYYAATVVTDRALGPCLARIAEAAERSAPPRKNQAAKAGLAQ